MKRETKRSVLSALKVIGYISMGMLALFVLLTFMGSMISRTGSGDPQSNLAFIRFAMTGMFASAGSLILISIVSSKVRSLK